MHGTPHSFCPQHIMLPVADHHRAGRLLFRQSQTAQRQTHDIRLCLALFVNVTAGNYSKVLRQCEVFHDLPGVHLRL